jgi:pyruvate,orthophosphate dikinase
VAGTHATEPLAVLDARLPEVGLELRRSADRLERHYADMCDIEFTIESGRLWLLQVRVGKRSPEAALRLAVEMAEDPAFPLTREAAVQRVATLLAAPPRVSVRRESGARPIVVGLAASPGIATGEIAVTPEDAVRVADEGRSVILVREETSPDDVHGMARAAGILTARGGIASHAAVVARGWGIPAVVNAQGIQLTEDGLRVGSTTMPAGAVITIDGTTGEVFTGRLATSSEDVVPAAATLLAWARDLGLDVGGDAADEGGPEDGGAAALATGTTSGGQAGEPAPVGGAVHDATLDDCLVAVALKGMATGDALAAAMGTSSREHAELLAGQLVDAGLASTVAGAYRLTESGRERHRILVEAERAAVGEARADELLAGLLSLDGEMKQTVTAWQLRDDQTGSEPVVNDHADPEYDASVLRRLQALADSADRWLAEAARSMPRLDVYRTRLRRAADAAIAGDGRFVASPRVDSYHGVWFELHEELILLAGRTREAEAAAGRA